MDIANSRIGGEMNSVLIVAAKANMIYQFNFRNISILKNMGFEVHVATNFKEYGSMDDDALHDMNNHLRDLGVVLHHIDFSRGLGDFKSNLKSITQLINVLKQRNKWAFMHVHSPLGSIIGRIAAMLVRVPVIYTAHGFHFFRGGPLQNWLIFPLEWAFSLITDQLIVINQNDYLISKYMPVRKSSYIPSIGTDVEYMMKQFDSRKRTEFRRVNGFNDEDFVFVAVGELNENKNHKIVIEAIKELPDYIKFVVAGVGPKHKEYEQFIVANNLEKRVKLLGYRKDLDAVYSGADAYIFPSRREGFGMGGFEALLSGLYVVGSAKTSMKDYLTSPELGELINVNNKDEVIESMRRVATQRLCLNLKKHETFLLNFDKAVVDSKMADIYKNYVEAQ